MTNDFSAEIAKAIDRAFQWASQLKESKAETSKVLISPVKGKRSYGFRFRSYIEEQEWKWEVMLAGGKHPVVLSPSGLIDLKKAINNIPTAFQNLTNDVARKNKAIDTLSY